jgi:hypothetical protein|tara:strand:- start:20245 stop:23691 length:3447 start_codon:yes stop_codon:yes gene_type:complete
MPKIFLTGSQSYKTGSGYLNNPARVLIRTSDNNTAEYPTIHRMNRKTTSGILPNITFDDTRTVKFGNRIKDEFEIKEIDVFNKHVDLNKWVRTIGVNVVRENDPQDDFSETKGAVVFGGKGDSEGRWLKTKKSVTNPTLIFKLLRGPYNDDASSRTLGLSQGAFNDVLKIQISTTGTSNWVTLPIKTFYIGHGASEDFIRDQGFSPGTFLFNAGVDLEGQQTITQENRPAINVKIGPAAFSSLGFTGAFYIRFIQAKANISNNDRKVWALDEVDIISREETVTYPKLNKNATADIFHASQSFASPNHLGGLTTTAASISGITDSEYQIIANNKVQRHTPFNEDSIVNYTNNRFYNEGTSPNITPGFNSGLLNKTKFKITLSSSQDTQIGLVHPPPQNTTTSYQNMMCYFNFIEKKWDHGALQGPRRYNQNIDDLLVSSSIGFGSLNPVGQSSTTQLNSPTRYPNFKYNGDFFVGSSVRPTNAFGFPSHAKFAPQTGSGQVIKASQLGITKPFLLEKVKVTFDASMQFSDIEDGSPTFQAYQLEGSKWSGSSFSFFQLKNSEIFIPTFFILRNFNDASNYTYDVQFLEDSASAPIEELSLGITIPESRHIVDRSSGTADTFNDNVVTGRELITYGQFTVYRSGSATNSTFINVPNDTTNYTLLDAPFSDSILESLERDAKILEITSSINNLDLNKFKMEFPCRNTIISKEIFSMFEMGKSGTDYTIFLDSGGGRQPQTLNSLSRNIGSSFHPRLDTFSSTEINVATTTVAKNKTFKNTTLDRYDRSSPYLIMPEDELIFGWQYPLPRQAQWGVSSGDDEFDEISMTLKGVTDIEFFGSQIKDGREFHEGLNQNLTSNAVYEVIGNEPVIDQWQVATRGEMTGSFIDSFAFAYNPGSPSYFLPGRTLFPKLNQLTRAALPLQGLGSDWQKLATQTAYDPEARINAISNSGYDIGHKNNFSIVGDTSGLTTFNTFKPGLSRFNNMTDMTRFFKDANNNNFNRDFYATLSYGSTQNFLDLFSGATPAVICGGGFPKYYFDKNNYGQISNFIRQGHDGRFNVVKGSDSTRTGNNVFDPPVTTQFVTSEYDNDNLNFRVFKTITPDDINGTHVRNFQSSNINLYSTSSLPFFDNGTAINRTYGAIEVIGIVGLS